MREIQELQENEIFVFDSNLVGIHGRGAALTAKRKFGAKQYTGEGLYGKFYTIPTKDSNIETLPLESIRLYVNRFLNFALKNPEKRFLVTPIGCGLAGYKPEDIAPMFRHVPKNVVLPESFLEVLNGC